MGGDVKAAFANDRLCLRAQVDVQDTVGCGDSFAAAVVLGFTRGHRIPPLLALANAVGAATAMGSGAGAALP